ncbi:putative bifunctional diguanylate cyclase/phosphodiesterase [Idiomarina sp.]|uniref:putative bifunctional diguanylate cyclase/phosphodiesterase n=1 Tax=Idiomarina sp. TaxID=1874361 RepID=UPI002EABB942|nr:bifunctional diguanylate cyclase/phosphodiesterase [Pseudomonadota bacterium]
MLNALLKHASTSVVQTAAFSCLLFGLFGFFNYLFLEPSARINSASLSLSAAALFIGTALYGQQAHRYWLTRFAGMGLIATGLYALNAKDLQLPLFLPSCCFLLAAVYLATGQTQTHRIVWKTVGSIFILISLVSFGIIWLGLPTYPQIQNPIAFSAATIVGLITGLGMLFYCFNQTPPRRSKLSIACLIFALSASISIWFAQSNADINEIRSRGEVNLTQSADVIGQRLQSQFSALTRLYRRWSELPASSVEQIINIDTEDYTRDFSLIQWMGVYDEEQNLLFSPITISQIDDEIINQPSIKKWRAENVHTTSRVISAYSLKQGSPRLILSYPITNPSIVSDQLIVVLDIKDLMRIDRIPYLDIFNSYVELSEEYLLPISSDSFDVISLSDLNSMHAYKVSASSAVLGQPVKLHAVIADPAVFWQAARVNQTILIAGILLAFLLLESIESNRKLTEQQGQLIQMANFDSVTQLMRRDVLERHINQWLLENTDDAHILFIDLDGFKPINDSLGLHTGNELLKHVATRLLEASPSSAQLSRFSSDEFILFLPQSSKETSSQVAERLLVALQKKFEIDYIDLYLTASIGIASRELQVSSAEAFIQNADVAMTKAKELGGNAFAFFTQAMGLKYQSDLTLRNQLQVAIEKRQLEVHYQPFVDLKTEKIIGVEALARWRDNDGNWVPPDVFIPLAEHTGQIMPLSALILEKAISEIAQYITHPNFVLSINLSPKQLQSGYLISQVTELAQKYKVPFGRLQFELTETMIVDDAKSAFKQLAELRTLGCKIAIDDFGTGYSSLSYLNDLPADIIKIDRSFTRRVLTDSASHPVTEAVISMALGMNKSITVEGIESAEEASYFVKRHCQAAQGFYYYRPMPLEQLIEVVEQPTT